jgi:hypothetical protein
MCRRGHAVATEATYAAAIFSPAGALTALRRIRGRFLGRARTLPALKRSCARGRSARSLSWVPTFYVLVARTTRGHDGGVACSDCSDCQRPVEKRGTAMTTIANDLLNRAKQEYVEMPGLVLTTRQASRLWNLDAAVCQALLSTLVHEQFLSRTHGGAYLRRGSGSSTVRANEPDGPPAGPR